MKNKKYDPATDENPFIRYDYFYNHPDNIVSDIQKVKQMENKNYDPVTCKFLNHQRSK